MVVYTFEDGMKYKVPAACCMTCNHCTDIFYDATHGPYAFICGKGTNTDDKDVCDLWESDGEYRQCIV